MSVLRYCCFRWLVYDRALVFEPSRPLACIMKLVWLIFICRVVLWYLTVSPWSWSYTFACMISVRSNWGRHKLVSEPTACRNPLSNSLVEVESSLWKTVLLTWLCVLRAHIAKWVVLGSFTPRLYSGTLISLLFGLNDFANSILGSRDHIHPEICNTPFLNWGPGSASHCSWAAWSSYRGHPASPLANSSLQRFPLTLM